MATINPTVSVEPAFGGAGIKTIMDVPLKVRPRVVSGDGTTNLTVSMIMRRNV